MTAKFSYDNVDPSQVRTGHIRVEYKVHGFWSSSSLCIYVRRDWGLRGELVNWTVDISRSSGGRDTKEEPCDIKANRAFAEALVHACDYAEELLKRSDEFEAEYQLYVQELRAEGERERAAKQKKIDDDAALGEEEAKALVNKLKEQAKSLGKVEMPYFARGADSASGTIKIKYYSAAAWSINSNRSTAAKVVEFLSQQSIRNAGNW